ncbi:hypothetical protein CPB83DRAFT_857805 [Crepidotus variabilis]|uniref:MARVEL domain-containing protein n=1 Tax=Crepidotus variabilis TaxID=179855 RepID=A0A9P6EBM1_9AGAR|nr:hypothetical protein CPB83DRAFT_857805 [Crepidotus variabilis]
MGISALTFPHINHWAFLFIKRSPPTGSSQPSTSIKLRKRRLSTAFGRDNTSPLSKNLRNQFYTTLPEAHRSEGEDKHRLLRTCRRGRKMPMLESRYHPLSFALMMLCGLLELGMTAWLISSGNETHRWTSQRYHSLLILLCFNSSWTTLFSTIYMLAYVDGASHFLANIASSVAWLVITTVLWGAGAGIMHNTRVGGNCPNQPTLSQCRQTLTVEAVGWAEFGLCALTMLLTVMWMVLDRTVKKERKEDKQRLV